MALGPMTGLFMHDHVSYEGIFITRHAVQLSRTAMRNMRKGTHPGIDKKQATGKTTGRNSYHKQQALARPLYPYKRHTRKLALLMLSIPYGATTNFVAMYAREVHLDVPSGFFFTLMAVGMGASRLVAGKKVDQGYITQCIHVGLYPVILAFFMLSMCRFIAPESMNAAEWISLPCRCFSA